MVEHYHFSFHENRNPQFLILSSCPKNITEKMYNIVNYNELCCQNLLVLGQELKMSFTGDLWYLTFISAAVC